MSLPWFDVTADLIRRHQADGRPLLRFQDIPLDLNDFRLLLRQAGDVLYRFGALDEADHQKVQTLARDASLLQVAGSIFDRKSRPHSSGGQAANDDEMVAEVLTIALRPFLARCAEVVQPRDELAAWGHAHCLVCGGEPELAVIARSADRHLICGRCGLRWKWDPLSCPFCLNGDRTAIASFATPDGRYRVYACNRCRRYLKTYDGRRAPRPVMPVVDMVLTMPLDKAAMERGYES